MKLKNRKLIIIISLLLLISGLITGCVNSGTEHNLIEDGVKSLSTTPNDQKEVNKTGDEEKKDNGEIEIVDYVKEAMEKSNHLTTGSYFLAEDGSILVYDKPYGNFAAEYATIPNLKKICDSSSEMEIFALTEDGQLYYHQTRVLNGVTDIVYSTTNSNQHAYAICGDKVYRLYVSSSASDVLQETTPEDYIDVGNEVVCCYEMNTEYIRNLTTEDGNKLNGSLSFVSAEKSDFFVLNRSGNVFVENDTGYSTEYIGQECFKWENMALIDAAKFMLSDYRSNERKLELTIAGIQADGTVLACGEYASDILSWGALSYLTMSDGIIVGLTKDGNLKITGKYAEFLENDVSTWKNIVAVKAGDVTGITVLNAMDVDGNFYHIEYESRWGEASAAYISPEAGSVGETDEWYYKCYKYCSDGNVFKDDGDGSWVLYE